MGKTIGISDLVMVESVVEQFQKLGFSFRTAVSFLVRGKNFFQAMHILQESVITNSNLVFPTYHPSTQTENKRIFSIESRRLYTEYLTYIGSSSFYGWRKAPSLKYLVTTKKKCSKAVQKVQTFGIPN